MEREGTHVRPTFEEYVKNDPSVFYAYNFSQAAHEGQKRAEGIPYFSHCVAVAKIIYDEWGINSPKMIAGALLHDVVEDTKITMEEVSAQFGTEVAFLVDGVSKFRSEKDNGAKSKEQKDRETVRKVFSKNLIDPRVGVLKLADRLHNMRTLEFMPPAKQVAKAKETEGYAKLAESLGMWKVMKELENLSMEFSCPEEYAKYSLMVRKDPRTSDKFVAWLASTLESIAANASISATVESDEISLPRLKNKMGRNLRSKINDLISFRVIIPEAAEIENRDKVYKMLGAVRAGLNDFEDFKRFDDSYSKPKDNNFRAISLTLDFPEGSVEVAITGHDDFNKWGVVHLIRNGEELSNHALKLIFTKTQEIKFFHPKATGLDFAYSISREMGARAIGVIINGKRVPASVVLPNGSEVEIELGNSRIAPEAESKNYCLPATRRIIEEQLSEKERVETEEKGEAMIREIILKRGLVDLSDMLKIDKYKARVEDMLFLLGCKNSVKNLYYKIGAGVMTTDDLELVLNNAKITKGELGLTSILMKGKDAPGITLLVSSKVSALGGNIGPMENRCHGEGANSSYSLKMIVENLSAQSEDELRNFLEDDQRVKSVLVV